ncbi:arylamine N-acetyltransferase [Hansschlegelia zhihuaiae]|uniref:Arylamine N-acetyltransferase n=2 Tax=Hansschlegelia zhihuaiae TaxID=405005 RepID=A0A4Q0M2V0_9HYPH|nr:arylamine N-acetyltransferase [Hansschlegelia zhihuaiae]
MTRLRRVLLIGRSHRVMQDLVAELRALGVEAEGETDPDRAADRPDAGAFDVVALGRGVTGETRKALRKAFAWIRPDVRLIDVAIREAPGETLRALEGRDLVDLDAYFARIGYRGPRDATTGTLRALVLAHLDAIPFESIDAAIGRGVDISPEGVDAKLIGAHRGGYCYEQNGLFKRVLRALGFEVDGLLARVRLNARPGDQPMARSHMTLKVTIEGEEWLADVGFGGATPTAPLRFDDEAPQPTPHGRYRVTRFGPLKLLEAESDGGWAPLYEVSDEPQIDVDYEPANWLTSTHPGSFFRRELVAARAAPGARYALYGARLTTRWPDGRSEQRMLSADEIERALTETFGLAVQPDWRPLIEQAAARV